MMTSQSGEGVEIRIGHRGGAWPMSAFGGNRHGSGYRVRYHMKGRLSLAASFVSGGL